MTDYNYNQFQQIYCLSMITGIVSKMQGTEKHLEDALSKSLDGFLPKLSGDWSITWGPRIYKEKADSSEGGPDNIWFAATDHTQKLCVVAIAGTASNSWLDLVEDFSVAKTVDFNTWVQSWSSQDIPEPKYLGIFDKKEPSRPYCAKGTALGVWNVLRSPSTKAGYGMRIDQYLQTAVDSDYTVVITGHSLGGALAPTLALGLVQAGIARNKIKVLASAGVSPGNEVLASEFSKTFPRDPPLGEGYSVFNTDFYNVYDIVPQAWSIDPKQDRNLTNITKIYQCDQGDFAQDVQSKINIAKYFSNLSGLQYTPLRGEKFTGPPPLNPVTSWNNIFDQFGTHHVLAYWDTIGISEYCHLFDKVVTERLEAKQQPFKEVKSASVQHQTIAT